MEEKKIIKKQNREIKHLIELSERKWTTKSTVFDSGAFHRAYLDFAKELEEAFKRYKDPCIETAVEKAIVTLK